MTSKLTTIDAYHAIQADADRAIMERLHALLTAHLPIADAKMWHAHPVWFIDGNPIAGYSKLKSCVRLMFWSGQSFDTPGLAKSGTFKAGEARFTDVDQIDDTQVAGWCADGIRIQWDYKNIVKNKGRLDRIC